MTTIWATIVATVSGVIMAFQGAVNTTLSKTVGLLEATFFVHLIGLLLTIILLFYFQTDKFYLQLWLQAPWFSYFGGIFSVAIIYLVAASISKLGVANTTTAIIIGQLLTAIIIDHFGFFRLEPISCSWSQFLGLVLLALGARLLLK